MNLLFICSLIIGVLGISLFLKEKFKVLYMWSIKLNYLINLFNIREEGKGNIRFLVNDYPPDSLDRRIDWLKEEVNTLTIQTMNQKQFIAFLNQRFGALERELEETIQRRKKNV